MAYCPNKNLEEWKLLVSSRGEDIAYYLWDKYEGNVPEIESRQSIVKAGLKAIQILNSDKAKQIFDKGNKNNWSLEKILAELAVPREQRELIKGLGKTNLNEIVTDLLANYSYTIEINTARKKVSALNKNYDNFNISTDNYSIKFFQNDWELGVEKYLKNGKEISQEEYSKAQLEYEKLKGEQFEPTQHYSNLTVPGGTAYQENEIATPSITPSIKGHAQFATDKGIGWFRSDEQAIVLSPQDAAISNKGNLTPFDNDYGKIPTKTRRILEIQSDLFQKGRDKEKLTEIEESPLGDYNTLEELKTALKNGSINKELYSIKKERLLNNINSSKNQFLQLLNKDNNWVTFFVKSIIQSTAKETIQEINEQDVENMVKSLQREGKLKIKCD